MRLALTLGSIAAGSLVVAFFQQWYVLMAIGPGVQTDALFAGMAIPQLILTVVSGSLVHVMVPLFSGEERRRAQSDAWTLLAGVAAFFGVAALLLISTARFWAPRMFPGFSGEGASLLIGLVRIQLIGMIGTASSGVLVAWCHSQRQFIRAEATQLGASIVTFLLLLWALPQFGISAAAWLSAARAALIVLSLFPALGWTRGIVWSTRVLKEGWRRIRPLLLGTVYYKTDPVVDRYLASMSLPGQLSLLHLAQQVFNAASQIVNIGLAAPAIPALAESAKHGHWDTFRSIVMRRVALILVLTLTAYFGVIAVGRPMLSLLIGHGGVTQENVRFLWLVMLGLGGVLIAGSIGSVTSGAFYAQGDTRTPTVLSVITYTIYIPLKIIAYTKWGVVALATATSLYAVLNAVIQLVLLERRRVRFLPVSEAVQGSNV